MLNLASNYASLFTYLMNGLVVFHIGIPCAVSNILGNLMGPISPEKVRASSVHDAGGAGAAAGQAHLGRSAVSAGRARGSLSEGTGKTVRF